MKTLFAVAVSNIFEKSEVFILFIFCDVWCHPFYYCCFKYFGLALQVSLKIVILIHFKRADQSHFVNCTIDQCVKLVVA